MIKNTIKRIMQRPRALLDRHLIEVRDVGELKKLFGWSLDPIITDPSISQFDNVCDLNERRLHDALVLGVACRNVGHGTFLEIGTSKGHGTALMAENAPEATIYTVNMRPEDVISSPDADRTHWTPSLDEIGSYYRARGHRNVEQILANTATWTPPFPSIDLAFVDGSHQRRMVAHDGSLVLERMVSGGFLLFHDFHPTLDRVMPWIRSVMLGVDDLYRDGKLKAEIFWVRDSWIGLYRVP